MTTGRATIDSASLDVQRREKPRIAKRKGKIRAEARNRIADKPCASVFDTHGN